MWGEESVMPTSAKSWVVMAALAVLAGCSSQEGGPPRLAGSGRLEVGVERAAVGSRGTLYCTTVSRGMMSDGQNVLQIVEPSGGLGEKVKLEPSTAEIKAIAADGRGKLYLGVKEGGKDQIWVLPEDARGVVYIAASDGDIRLRGYDAAGTLLFNVVEQALDRSPERLLVGRDDRLYALLGQKMLVFRP
jgi:hypothetical protein